MVTLTDNKEGYSGMQRKVTLPLFSGDQGPVMVTVQLVGHSGLPEMNAEFQALNGESPTFLNFFEFDSTITLGSGHWITIPGVKFAFKKSMATECLI